jgi:hypothetical protein
VQDHQPHGGLVRDLIAVFRPDLDLGEHAAGAALAIP